jgi:hypothetical protein
MAQCSGEILSSRIIRHIFIRHRDFRSVDGSRPHLAEALTKQIGFADVEVTTGNKIGVHNTGYYRQAPVRFLKPGYLSAESFPRGFLALVCHPNRWWS